MPDETVRQAGSHEHLTPPTDADLVHIAEGVEHLRAGLRRLRESVEINLPPDRIRSVLTVVEAAELALDEVLRRSGAVDAGIIDPPGTVHGVNCDCCVPTGADK